MMLQRSPRGFVTALLLLGVTSFTLLFLLRSGEDMEALEGLLRSEAGCPQFSEGAPLGSERRKRHWATRYSNEAVYQRMRSGKCEMGQHEQHQKGKDTLLGPEHVNGVHLC